MHTTYTGQLVRLRPFAGRDEFSSYLIGYGLVPNEQLGIQWDVPAMRNAEWDRLATAADSFVFAIERMDTGEFCGLEYTALGRWQLAGFVATGVQPQHQSRGFGREAKLLALCHLFENFAIESVWADTIASHSRSRAGLEAIGMRLVGCNQLAHFRRGRWFGMVQYQLLRSAWEQMDYRHRVARS